MLRPRFSSNSINGRLKEFEQRIEQAIVSRLQYIGETFVNNARSKTRSNGGFGDVTGNLRSSIGYIVMAKSKIVAGSAFDVIGNGGRGSNEGKKYIKKIAKKHNNDGFMLIVVAGMDYAAVLESKGKDVITGSSLIAEQELREALENIKKRR